MGRANDRVQNRNEMIRETSRRRPPNRTTLLSTVSGWLVSVYWFYEGHQVWILKFQPQAGAATIRIIRVKKSAEDHRHGFFCMWSRRREAPEKQQWDSAETSLYFAFQMKREQTVDRLSVKMLWLMDGPFDQIKAGQLTSSWGEGAFGIKRRISARPHNQRRLLHPPQFGCFRWGSISRWTAGGSSGCYNWISNFYQIAEYKLSLFKVFFLGPHFSSVGASFFF